MSGNFAALGSDLLALEKAGVDLFHIDVMDAHFVPNLAMSPAMVRDLRPLTDLSLDVHLMMTNPSVLLDAFGGAGASAITVHVEIQEDILGLLTRIRASGQRAGIALNPDTDPKDLLPYLDHVDQVLVMTVHPGFAGSPFQARALDTLTFLDTYRRTRGMPFVITVDGAITPDTAGAVTERGADVLVSGSYLVSGPHATYAERLRELRDATKA